VRTLILVENLSVPFDRRVWQEAKALRDAGGHVSVICPRGSQRDTLPFERLEGIDIHRYPLTAAAGGPAGYVREYGTAFTRTARLVRRVARRNPVDVVHACNPPDLLFASALWLRRHGARFIFDHHDLVPELVLSRFGEHRRLLYRATIVAERMTFALADVVIATNESYRRIAIDRGGFSPSDVFVVRSAPDLKHFGPVPPDPSLKRGKAHLIVYLGVMGPQDGVDHALRALALLGRERDDWRAIFIGDGDVRSEMVLLAGELGLHDAAEFTGRIPDTDVQTILSTADVCLAPDPQNPLNEKSTMNKILEYMAIGKPIVSYDLAEARASAGQAALYAVPNSESSFCEMIKLLLDDDEGRERMGREGRLRLERELSWEHSKRELLRAYDHALAGRGSPPLTDREPPPGRTTR
jgi:glycosyltransferase involved in cell wall biosynthesis